MRRIAVAIGVVILVVIMGAAIFVATFDVNKYRGTIQSELQKRLGRSVTLGAMHLKLFPPRFGVQDLAIQRTEPCQPRGSSLKVRIIDTVDSIA